MSIANVVHDPDADLDYQIDWSEWLWADTISSSSWTADSLLGVTLHGSVFTSTTATIWVKGGKVNMSGLVTNHIETSGGRKEDRSLLLMIRNL